MVMIKSDRRLCVIKRKMHRHPCAKQMKGAQIRKGKALLHMQTAKWYYVQWLSALHSLSGVSLQNSEVKELKWKCTGCELAQRLTIIYILACLVVQEYQLDFVHVWHIQSVANSFIHAYPTQVSCTISYMYTFNCYMKFWSHPCRPMHTCRYMY